MTDPVPATAPNLPEPRRVALIHDWLTGMRGGEKCLEVLAEIFPGADLYTLLHVPGSVGGAITELAYGVPDAGPELVIESAGGACMGPGSRLRGACSCSSG